MDKKPRFLVGLVLLGLLGLALWLPAQAAQSTELENGALLQGAQLELLRSDQDAVGVRLTTPDFDLRRVELDGQVFDTLTVDGLALTAEVGHPQLPFDRVLVGIPLNAALEVNVVRASCEALSGAYNLAPASSPVFPEGWGLGLDGDPASFDYSDRSAGGEVAYVQDPLIYSQDSFYPAGLAALDSAGFLRNQRYAAIHLYPFQYNPASGQLRFCRELEVEVAFNYPDGAVPQDRGKREPAGAFEPILSKAILNYPAARAWRGNEQRAVGAPRAFTLDDPIFKVLIEEDGIYRLTSAELAAAGVPTGTLDPATIRIYAEGVEIPIYVADDGGVLDYLLFYGQKVNTIYTDTNVYWLTYGGVPGVRMSSRSSPPSGSLPVASFYTRTARFEEDNQYLSQIPAGEGTDHWFRGWTWYPTTIPFLTFDFSTSHIITAFYSATLRANMHGYTDLTSVNPDHCIQLYLNDQPVFADDLVWDGRVEQNPVATFSSTMLISGTNQMRIQGCATAAVVDIILHNWIEIDYRDLFVAEGDSYTFEVVDTDVQYEIDGFSSDDVWIFDVSNVYSTSYLVDSVVEPSALGYVAKFSDAMAEQGSDYMALNPTTYKTPIDIMADTPSDLANPANQADYIMISHASLITELLALRDYRAAQGLTTMVVGVQDVYDEFNYGVFSADAIHDFLDYAYHNWASPAPTYVVLVGDGTLDYKNNLGTGEPVLMPPILAFVDPWIGETAVDNRFVTVAGGDVMPDMLIGRLPAETPLDLQNILAKTFAHEQGPPGLAWNQHLLFVTDNPDTAGNFYSLSDDVVDNFIPPAYTVNKVYLGLTCAYENPSVVCKQELMDAINITGTLFVNFVGHSGNSAWAAESLLAVDDVDSLANDEVFPIMLPMTCLEGSFHYPGVPSLGDSLVRVGQKGAAASWSPTGLGVTYGHDYLNEGFYETVFSDDIREIGAAAYVGKLWLYTAGISQEQIEEYTLFGDPALRINALNPDLQIQKTVEPAGQVQSGDVLTYTLTFSNAGPVVAHHVVLADILPPELVSATVVYSSPEVLTQHVGVQFTWDITDLLTTTVGTIRIRAVVGPADQPGLIVNEAELATPVARAVVSITNELYVPNADVEIAKAVEPAGQVRPGRALTYTLTFTNRGPEVAPGVVVTDVLPPELVSATVVYSSPEVISQHLGLTFAWSVANLAPGGGGEIQVRAVVDPALQPGNVVVNEAEIAADLLDVVPGNNAVSVTTGIQVPDLFVDKTGPAGVSFGTSITYTIAWGNAGEVQAPGVRLTDTLPAGVTYVADNSGLALSQPTSDTLVWEVAPGLVPTGSLFTFIVTGAVALDPGLADPLVNQVEIAATLPDGDPGDNDSAWSTDLLWPDVDVTKTGVGTAYVGSAITYTVVYSNAGDGLALGAVVTELLPVGLTYVSDDSGLPHSEPVSGTHVWQAGDLAAGERHTFHVLALVGTLEETGGVVTNSVQVGSVSPDADPGNGEAQWATGVVEGTRNIYLPLVLKNAP